MRRALTRSAAILLLALATPAAGAGKADVVRWRPLEAGEAEARKAGKPVFYFFTADWCGPCHVLVEEVFSDKKAAAAIEKRYVPVLLEDRRRQEGKNAPGMDDLVRRFGVKGFPTLIVSNPGANQGLRLTGWAGRQKTLDFIDGAAERLKKKEAETRAAEAGKP
jgi:thiol:disulfide interchange protein